MLVYYCFFTRKNVENVRKLVGIGLICRGLMDESLSSKNSSFLIYQKFLGEVNYDAAILSYELNQVRQGNEISVAENDIIPNLIFN